MTQSLVYADLEVDEATTLETTLEAKTDAENWLFHRKQLLGTRIKQIIWTKVFPVGPDTENAVASDFTHYERKFLHRNYRAVKRPTCH